MAYIDRARKNGGNNTILPYLHNSSDSHKTFMNLGRDFPAFWQESQKGGWIRSGWPALDSLLLPPLLLQSLARSRIVMPACTTWFSREGPLKSAGEHVSHLLISGSLHRLYRRCIWETATEDASRSLEDAALVPVGSLLSQGPGIYGAKSSSLQGLENSCGTGSTPAAEWLAQPTSAE